MDESLLLLTPSRSARRPHTPTTPSVLDRPGPYYTTPYRSERRLDGFISARLLSVLNQNDHLPAAARCDIYPRYYVDMVKNALSLDLADRTAGLKVQYARICH